VRRRLTLEMARALRRVVRNELIGARSIRNYNPRTVRALHRHGWIALREGYMIPTGESFSAMIELNA
jgi:hypothetical protein